MRALFLALILWGCASQEPAPVPRDLAALAAGKTTKDEFLAALGGAEVIEFDSGYEVWVYRAQPPAPHSELVLLFDRSGRLARTRLRR
jgi:hypothetical protein